MFHVSLNNRRLWVLKQLHERGYFANRALTVRVKDALPQEKERYTTERCSLHAKVMKEFGCRGGAGGDRGTAPELKPER